MNGEFNLLIAGVFVETLIAAAGVAVLVMDRIGARQFGLAFLVGVFGGTVFLAPHFLWGPELFTLTKRELMMLVAAGGIDTVAGLSIAVILFRPRKSRNQHSSHTTNSEIEP